MLLNWHLKVFSMLAGCCLLIVFAGCGPKTQFVLMPDPEGRVGEIFVSNDKGAQTLNQAWQATEISSPNLAPAQPAILNENAVRSEFKEALSALPAAPISFLLYFKPDSSELTEESQALWPKIIEAIFERKTYDISVIGHSDRTGSAEYNRKLSLQRASNVAQLLVDKGANPKNIEVTYHGEENPLIPTADGVAEPKNRRVEITIR